MAYWAWAMFATTVVTAALTGIGVVLIGFTLKYTKDTLGEAKAATTAAQDTVTVTREIGEAQTRAYISVFQAGLRIETDVPEVVFRIRNTGNSPAKTVQFSYRARMDGEFAREQPKMIGANPFQIRDMAPQAEEQFTHKFEDFRFVPEEMEAMDNRQTIPFGVKVRITYFDVFDAEVSQEINWEGHAKKETFTGLRRNVPAISPLRISRPQVRQ